MSHRDIKGTFHARMGMGTVRNRNGKDITEAEEIKNRFQEFTEELYKNGVNDLDSHNGVVTHLEPGTLECEVKWDLGSITVNKAIGRDGIPVYTFKILKADVVKVLHSICQQIGKIISGHRRGKYQFSFQSQKRAMQKIMFKLPYNWTHFTC